MRVFCVHPICVKWDSETLLHWFAIPSSSEVNNCIVLSRVPYLYCVLFLSLFPPSTVSFPFIRWLGVCSGSFIDNAELSIQDASVSCFFCLFVLFSILYNLLTASEDLGWNHTHTEKIQRFYWWMLKGRAQVNAQLRAWGNGVEWRDGEITAPLGCGGHWILLITSLKLLIN